MSNQKIKTMNLKQTIDQIRLEQGIGRRGGLVVKVIVLDAQDVTDLGQMKTAKSTRTGNDYSFYDLQGTRVFPARTAEGTSVPAAVGQVLEITRGTYNDAPVLNFNLYA